MKQAAVKAKALKGKGRKSNKSSTISHLKKPANLTVIEWQAILRKQISGLQKFRITNVGTGMVFSDYTVYNTATQNSYKVALRSKDNTLNFCSCYDFKTNQLGTCKHIEAVLSGINKSQYCASCLTGTMNLPIHLFIFLTVEAEK